MEQLASLNSYGYSPHPLSVYLEWILTIISADRLTSCKKPFILSITASEPTELSSMLDVIQHFRSQVEDAAGETSRIAVEINTSCPNIEGSPPPAYDFPSLRPILQVLSEHFRRDTTLTLGLKLPPYVYRGQFEDVVKEISTFSWKEDDGQVKNPFAFFTCTNTLGSSILFTSQTIDPSNSASPFALQPVLGG